MPWDSIQSVLKKSPAQTCVTMIAQSQTSRGPGAALLDGLPGGGLNIAYEAVDRHVAHGLGDKIALRWIGQDNNIRDFTYSDLQRQTNKFANALVPWALPRASACTASWVVFPNFISPRWEP